MSRVAEDDLEFEYYRQLKDGLVKIRSSGSGYYCPFCYETKKTFQRSKDLLQHATQCSEASARRDMKERAKHKGLVRYIEKHYGNSNRKESSSKKAYDICDRDDRVVSPRQIAAAIRHHDKLVSSHNEEISKLQQIEREAFQKIVRQHDRMKENLAKEDEELKLRVEELKQREHKNNNESKKLLEQQEMIARATLEQNKNEEKMFKLAQQHKIEKEKLHKEILQLKKQIDSKQALELQIERYKGGLEVMKHMGGDDDEDRELEKNIKLMKEKLEETEEQFEAMEDLNQTLIVKERKSNDELQDARKEMISGLGQRPPRASIGVKRMGDLDIKPFVKATKSEGSVEECQAKAVKLCQLWDSYLRDPAWHPFKIFTDKQGKSMEIINEDDERLRGLRPELGEEVYEAVIRALKEMNEHNPSGRYPVPDIWNFKEKRRASLSEAVEYLLKQWKNARTKKN